MFYSKVSRERWLWLFVSLIPLISFSPYLAQNSPSSLCPVPALSRIQRHRVAPGETIESIAKRYKLIPATLIRLNPSLAQGKVPVDEEILVPPFDGIRVQVPNGATWKDLSTAYGVRADVLFEINGCVPNPKVVFIPGVNWQPGENIRRGDYTGLKSYPLPFVAAIGLGYGWHTNPTTGQSFFHGGVDLLAEPGTPVLAADRGTVIFVAQEGSYGFLVVVDHGNGRQTRYAHLSRFKAKMGQSVQAGDVLGYVGATGKPDILQPHLHFEVRYKFPVGWVAQDPETHFPKVSP